MFLGLSNADAAKIVAVRGKCFASVDDVWCRAAVSPASLVKIADADGFRETFGLARRDALWALLGLRDQPLPLFAAAVAADDGVVPEQREPTVELKRRTQGGEVVEDYSHVGLTLREHFVSFLRNDLAKKGRSRARQPWRHAQVGG